MTHTSLKIGGTNPALTETLANFNACVNEGGTGRKEEASGPKVWCDAAAGVAEAAAIVFLVTIVCRGRRWVSRDTVKIMGFYGVSGLVTKYSTCILC